MAIKLKVYLFLFAVVAGLVGIRLAYAVSALTWSADTAVTIDSVNYTIESGSEATSIVVDSTTLTVVVPASTTFTISSSDRFVLNNDQSLSTNCIATKNSLTITGVKTVVITPDKSTICTTPSTTSSGSRPDYQPPVVPAVDYVALSATTQVSASSGICPNGNTVASNCTVPPTAVSTTVAVPVKQYDFGILLVRMGTKGKECLAWQSFLNDYANAGLVTDSWCGILTMAAAREWQASQGLIADGLLGPKSRAKARMY